MATNKHGHEDYSSLKSKFKEIVVVSTTDSFFINNEKDYEKATKLPKAEIFGVVSKRQLGLSDLQDIGMGDTPSGVKLTKIAGFSYAVGELFISLVGNKVPFNSDTIKDINQIWLDIKTDDGEGSVAPNVKSHQSSGPLTYMQEKQGLKRE